MFNQCTVLSLNLMNLQGRLNLITNMAEMFNNCQKITGSPICGENVISMQGTYQNCRNLTGTAVCGPLVQSMDYTYSYCFNLTNAFIGNNVISTKYTYDTTIQNLNKRIFYFNYNSSADVNAYRCFNNRNGLGIIVFVKPNSKWNNWFYNNAHLSTNDSTNYIWTNIDGGYYNDANRFMVRYKDETNSIIYLNSFYCYNVLGGNISITNNVNSFVFDQYLGLETSYIYNTNNIIHLETSSSTESCAVEKNTQNNIIHWQTSGNFNNIPIYFNSNCDYTFYEMANLDATLQLNINNKGFRGDLITNMSSMFYNCRKLKMNIDNFFFNNCINMSQAFSMCWNMSGTPKSGPNVINMHQAYSGVGHHLTGPAACGDNVTEFEKAYINCFNITSAMFGNSVINYNNAYIYCNNIETIIINCNFAYNLMRKAFCYNNTYKADLSNVKTISFGGNCKNAEYAFINGDEYGLRDKFTSLFIDNSVTDIAYIFKDCYNIKISPKCSIATTNMHWAYTNCYNIIGSPVCGDNVTDMVETYWCCYNLTGTGICGNKVTNAEGAYLRCYNITNGIIGSNVTFYKRVFDCCNNLQRIEIYCPSAYKFAQNAFFEESYNTTANLNWNKTNLSNITNIIFGNDCTNLSYAFYNAQSLKNNVNIIIGNNVKDISYIFFNCYGLKSSPICEDSVTNMRNAFYNCHNLTNSPTCGNNVTDMSYAFYDCYNLSGSPVCGNKVTNMSYAFYNCRNLTGNIIVSNSVIYLNSTFWRCVNISTIVISRTAALTIDNMANMCNRNIFTTRLNVIIINQTTYTRLRSNTTWANASFTASAAHSETIVINGISYAVKNWAYNTARNVYLYCTA